MFKKLIHWSDINFPHLPWRKHRSLYGTLVSEIMLQQTTVPTVLNYFEKFLKVFPDIKTLAQASEEEVCIQWKGLGYYRRARNLLKATQYIQKNCDGKIPLSVEALKKIPGIGEYTAHALLAIGENQNFLCVDANLERVLARYYGLNHQSKNLKKEIYLRFLNQRILPDMAQLGARKVNEALMDLGRTLCQANKVQCELCPLQIGCHAFKKNQIKEYLQKIKKKESKHELHLLRVLVRKGQSILVYKKSDKEWLSGQYELPTFQLSSSDESLKQYQEYSKEGFLKLRSYKTTITKYKIKNFILQISHADFLKKFPQGLKYQFKKNSSQGNFSVSTLKAINLIQIGFGLHLFIVV